MIALKNNQTLRIFVVFGISLVTMLLLLSGSIMIQRQGLAPFATIARAASVSSCARLKGTQPTLCEHQDPIVQGCVTDAETLDIQTVFRDRQQTKPLGEVELRYSPTCRTYWVRTTVFATTREGVKAIHAMLIFHDQTKEDSVGIPAVNTTALSVAWTDMTLAPIPPHVGSGSFELVGQSQPIILALKE